MASAENTFHESSIYGSRSSTPEKSPSDHVTTKIENLNLNGSKNGAVHNIDPFKGIIRNNHRAKDITEQFARASNALHVGQLVKDENFSLFDSVQALELLDPKMDTGYLEPGESLEDDYDVCRDLLPMEVIGIMDQLLCYYVSWLGGFPLAQNVFSSLYIDHLLGQQRDPKVIPKFVPRKGHSEPSPLVQQVLRAFCIGIIKSCDVVIEMIQSQYYFEEEDFNTHTFNRTLLSDLDDEECLQQLRTASKWLLLQKELDQPVKIALDLRLTVCSSLYYVVLPTYTSERTSEEWKNFVDSFDALQSSHQWMSLSVPEAFSAKVQRRLASTVPPRAIMEVPFDEACKSLKNLFRDVEEAMRLAQLHRNTSLDLNTMITALFAYSNRNPEPLPLARAILQSVLFSEGAVADERNSVAGMGLLLMNTIRNSAPEHAQWLKPENWAVEVPTDIRYKTTMLVSWYIEQLIPDCTSLLRTLCQNPCRIRRCLANIVHDFDALNTEVITKLFGVLPPVQVTDLPGDGLAELRITLWRISCGFQWRILEWINQLGFELDIYRSDEYFQLYILLRDQTNTRWSFIQYQIKDAQAIVDLNKILAPKRQDEGYESLLRRLHSQELECMVTMKLAESLVFLYGFHGYMGMAEIGSKSGRRDTQSYFTLKTYTEAREKPFLNLQHGNVLYSEKERWQNEILSRMKTEPSHGLSQAGDSLREVMTLLKELSKLGTEDPALVDAAGSEETWKKNIQASLRICIQASVNVTRLTQELAKYDGDIVELTKHVTVVHGKHRARCWIVPDIKMI